MEFFRIQRVIPFMKHALVFNVISLVTFVLAVFFLATRGLNLGVDFRGGTLIELAYTHPADLGHVRAVIDKMNLGEFAVQSFGSSNSALIRLPLKQGMSTAQLSESVMTALKADDPESASNASNSSARRSARNCTRTARSPCFSSVSASSLTWRCVSSGGLRYRRSSPTCTMSSSSSASSPYSSGNSRCRSWPQCLRSSAIRSTNRW